MDAIANCVSLLCIAHFLWSYYWNCYRKGYTLDLWHFSLGMSVLISHVMLPFSRSSLNALALGPALWVRTAPLINEAYLINALGYVAIVMGGSLWRLRLGLGLRRGFARIMELPVRGVFNVLRSPRLVILHCLISILLLSITLSIYFAHSGLGFNLRGLLLVMPALRPLAQFAAFYSTISGGYAVARFAVYRERIMLWLTLVIALGFIFYGERSNIFLLFLTVGLVNIVRMRRRLRLFYVFAGSIGLLFLVMVLDALRKPGFSLVGVVRGLGVNIFFGNSFSDTRDFALILSFWNGEWLLGKTYLAGLLGFIPRFLSTFRDKWALGVVTATMAGFSPQEHPGLRVGASGEAFLNFGLVGVVLLGPFVGSAQRLLDLRVKQSLLELPRSGMRVYAYFVISYVIGVAQNSTGASTFYTVLVFIGLSWTILQLSRFLKLPLG